MYSYFRFFSFFIVSFVHALECDEHNSGSTHMTNGNGVLTILSNGSHVNGEQANNHVFYEKSPIINGFIDKRNGCNTTNGTHHLQQSPPQAVPQQTPAAQATNSRRRTISSNSNG